MKHLMTLLCILMLGTASAQLKIETTYDQAFTDLSNNATNEGVFYESGVFSMIFKNTPVGIAHAVKRYNQLRDQFKLGDCLNEDIIASTVIKKKDETLDNETLALSIRAESSEINRSCLGKGEVLQLRLRSSRNCLFIYVTPKDKMEN